MACYQNSALTIFIDCPLSYGVTHAPPLPLRRQQPQHTPHAGPAPRVHCIMGHGGAAHPAAGPGPLRLFAGPPRYQHQPSFCISTPPIPIRAPPHAALYILPALDILRCKCCLLHPPSPSPYRPALGRTALHYAAFKGHQEILQVCRHNILLASF